MAGKVEPFSVTTTSGLRRRIVDWLETNFAAHGLRLGFIYYTTVSRRNPKCQSCKHGTRDQGMTGGRGDTQPVYCDRCGGAGVIMPGFSE